MRLKRISKAVALGATFALALSACSPGGPAAPTGSPSAGSTGKYSVEPTNTGLADLGDITTASGSIAASIGEDEFISYNGFTPEANNAYNSVVTERIQSSFSYFGTDGAVYQNPAIGSIEKVSDSPLTIKYTINPDAVWSDGTPITTADAVLAWALQNANLTVDGKPIFNSVAQDLGDQVPKGPKGEASGKEFTLVYAEPNPDWEIQSLLIHPAHIVAEQGGLSTAEFVAAALAGDGAKLEKAADFWNTGWNTDPGTVPDPALALSSGPYKIDSWEAGQSITLTANDKWWGTPAATEKLVIRFAAADTHVQALQNADLDVVEPQATIDTVAQLEGLGDDVQILAGDTLSWEHLDFNFAEGNKFGGNPELRQAFALCVPRQQIVDNLIKPLNPGAQVMNAREVFPFQENYGDVVSAAYSGQYDAVDIEGAKRILEEQNATGVKVRIGYNAPNPRRTDVVAMIKSSCDQAGFEVVDVGSGDFFSKTLPNGDYDVALYAWSSSGQITSGENIYATGKPQNYSQYSNRDVDAAWRKLATSLDPAVQLEQTKAIEKLLWEDLHGIPLFAHPGITAARADVLNVRRTAAQSTVLWNAEQWLRAPR
ncbi:peptide ABC transporter substrate-binding protein [Zafaria cholistanensis]|uniref:Peptide ABC transporter substrate-binding protein n=1 Tax=Zafaria cholistanensis TaxID=1682741 RepID=A0A5A7NPU1_9MICC|nr:ABC transporter family substrate-binding protein [Zafaria cholistanensis]GER21781.1 peptide ABC transporter substrate-binding protein [Zafaria cholistanensis]